ncbi:MAG TPA: hypothetical protein PKA99_07250 [Dermatophilaceae bacterium]|jgi:plasmid stability protein|nr:hypothetical protein [Dermatophilaceae bacterium]
MKTTMDLPDDLLRTIRLKAAREDRTMREVTTELLRRGLAAPASTVITRVTFPLVACPSTSSAGLTPDELAAELLRADAESAIG